ncbi:MAG TPA: dihydrofolate reductase [Mycobacteriales bacterium]|nr:dihydrofolate reductase [Mycobacteriales bacterium]
MTVSLIWAEAADRVIGLDGAIPWHLPEDLQMFKRLTMGATVVMGRATWESLPPSVRPLPGRRNVVVTHQESFDAEGAEVTSSLEAALDDSAGDVWVIGGASLYEQALDRADQVVRTRVHVHVDGDTRAPVLGPEWTLVDRDPAHGLHTSSSGLTYCVATLRRLG